MMRSLLQRFAGRATAVALLAMVLMTASARASILTFDLVDPTDFPRELPQAYGDNIASTASDGVASSYGEGNGFTPNIALSYSLPIATPVTPPATPSSFQYYDSEPYWPGVAWLFTNSVDDTSPRIFDITFTPSGPYGVRINSFDLNRDLTDPGNQTLSWSVLAGATVLYSGGPISLTGSQEFATVTTGMTSYYFGTLTLELNHTSGNHGYLALDNVNFDEIPEPASATTLMVMTTAILGKRKRR